jgi:acetolactate decarboxylase
MRLKTLCLGFGLFLGYYAMAQQTSHQVTIIGEMKNVMRKGQLYGNIHLDTITNKTHLYGLGPTAYLRGEIMILDGKSYKSTVVSKKKMKMEETYDIEAPFFGYANIAQWTEHKLPDSVRTISQLESYIDLVSKSSPRPFMFRLTGTVKQATIHVVNLPEGSKVSSPEEAHKGQINYYLNNVKCEVLGLFSTQHKTIFTHHDTFLHMHMMTADRKKMGHLDAMVLKEGATLYLPK